MGRGNIALVLVGVYVYQEYCKSSRNLRVIDF